MQRKAEEKAQKAAALETRRAEAQVLVAEPALYMERQCLQVDSALMPRLSFDREGRVLCA